MNTSVAVDDIGSSDDSRPIALPASAATCCRGGFLWLALSKRFKAFNEARIDAVAMKRRVGYVPDRPNIYSWMTTGEAIAFVRSFHAAWNPPRGDDLVRRFRLPLTTKVKTRPKRRSPNRNCRWPSATTRPF